MSNQLIVQPNLPGVQDLARSAISRFDRDGDGQFSHVEFASFLETFIRQVAGPAAGGASTSGRSQGLAASTAPPVPPVMPGWDAAKWADASHTSVKYVAGRAMARYRPADWLDAAKREEILAAFRAAGLDPTPVGLDKVDFNDGFGPIDIVQSAREGGRAWQWIPAQ